MPTARQLIARRLANQRLTRRLPSTPRDLVAWFGAVQAQDYTGARWALGLRIPDLTDADVSRAFDAGEIIRTHVLRPTWHFVAPQDLRWLQALTGPRVLAQTAGHDRRLGVTTTHHRKAADVIARELEAGRHCTREELGAALERRGLPSSGVPLASLMMAAEMRAEICSGPRRGRQFTYALVDERIPPSVVPDRDEMLGRLAQRYFASHGPATVRDMSWWSGLTMADVSRGIAVAGTALTQELADGLTYISARDAEPPPRWTSRAWLLPNYDESLIAYRDRSLSMTPGDPSATDVRAMLAHQLLVDGRVAGTWQRVDEKTGVLVRLLPKAALTAAHRVLVDANLRALATFLERPATVQYETEPIVRRAIRRA